MAAKTLIDVDKHFKKTPVGLEQFDELYVNADEGRGNIPTCKRLQRTLNNEPDGALKILFAGHKGCGKSTELVRLQREIKNDFIVLNYSVLKELDIVNINYMELFIATMEQLFKFVERDERVKVDDKYFENVKNWLKTEEIKDINNNYMGMNIEGQVKAKLTVPFLASFFSKFRTAAKTSSSMKKTLIQKIEPKLSDLIFHCNALINEIKGQLPDIGKKGLLIIIEDLDKVDLQRGEDIFYIHSTQLTQLNCHCIFTFPISLMYNIKYKNIITRYNETFVLPMIKVNNKDGKKNENGTRVIRNIVLRRMDESLFENLKYLSKMIALSGGCLLDLFCMIKEAASTALDFDREKICQSDYESAYRALKSDYERTIAENTEKKITVDQYYQALSDCAFDEQKKPKFTDIILDLMNNLTILNYNGDNWCDTHPVVKEILKEHGITKNDINGK